MSRRFPAFRIDRLLKSNIRGAELNDTYQARLIHKYLLWMLSEQELPGGQWWLTEYGKTILADMHDKLSQCPEGGDELVTRVLDAVMLTPSMGERRNLGDVKRDSEIAISVSKECENQRNNGNPVNITQACKNVAESGGYRLEWATIRNIYYRFRKYYKGDRAGFVPSHILKQEREEKTVKE